MENQSNSPEKRPKGLGIFFIFDFLISFQAEYVAHPFRSGLIYLGVGAIIVLFIGWILFPMVLYSEQSQPLNFSHALHMDPEMVDGIEGETEVEKCLYCHDFRDDGTFAGIPKLETCTECHEDPESPMGEDPEEVKFLTLYVAEEKEVPWSSYFKQPDCVYFPHIAHVKMGELGCRVCHGDHGKSDKLPIYKQNRLTGYSINIYGKHISGYKANPWDGMKMDDCSDCHTRTGNEKNNACFVCHK